ncbi:MAG: HDIG domain-containing metalloprotein [Verrucomicrobiota bacterium]
MLKAFRRSRLKAKGLSCGKSRKTNNGSEFIGRFRENPWIRALIIFLFGAALSSLVLSSQSETTPLIDSPAKALLVAIALYVAALVHLRTSFSPVFRRNSRLLLLLGAIFVHFSLVRFLPSFATASGLTFATPGFALLLIPHGFAPMLLGVLLGKRLGLLSVLLVTMWGALFMSGANVVEFGIISGLSGFVAAYLTNQVRKRSSFLRAGVFTGMTAAVLGIAIGLIAPSIFSGPLDLDWKLIGYQVLSCVGVGIVTAAFIATILPVLESLFRLTTDVSWLELADLNHPLLKRMSVEASGTYHHSIMVANLAESAAEAIHANAILCRVCSYFHDIGKLLKPEYFIENIAEGENPHDDLTPTMSALVIIAHVKDGVDIAVKHRLNEHIIDIIKEHHGDSLVYFFYRRAQQQKKEIAALVEEGKAHEEDIPEVSEEGFRYPGPRPKSKESGIISLADAIESASRSLQKPTPRKIKQTINEVINARIIDGQLSDADLTFRELTLIRESFYTTLRSMMHSRIQYPKDETEGGSKKKKTKKEKSGPLEKDAESGAVTV